MSVAKVLFNLQDNENIQTIQALLILALWAPICGLIKNGIGDGRVLITTAVSIATNMRLNEASLKVINLPKDDPEYPTHLDHARLVSFRLGSHQNVSLITKSSGHRW
jgi:hypothetical protein